MSDEVPFHSHDSDSHDPDDVGSRIDPVLARSWLLVNGAHGDRFEAAALPRRHRRT